MSIRLPIGGAVVQTAAVNSSVSEGISSNTTMGSADVKKDWVEVVSSLPYAIQGMFVGFENSGTSSIAIFDIGIGASSSEVVVVPDILFGGARRNDDTAHTVYIPLALNEGTRVAHRMQSVGITTDVYSLTYQWVAAGPHSAGFSSFESIGTTTSSDTTGVTITTNSTANTKSTPWDELSSSVANNLCGIIVCIGLDYTLTANSEGILVDIGIGASSSEVVIVPDLFFQTDAFTDFVVPAFIGPIMVDIPVGSRLSARAQSGNGSFAFDLALLGIVR